MDQKTATKMYKRAMKYLGVTREDVLAEPGWHSREEDGGYLLMTAGDDDLALVTPKDDGGYEVWMPWLNGVITFGPEDLAGKEAE